MRPSPSEISRLVSRLLRHEPWLYELELDDEGWVPMDALLAAIRRAEPGWSEIDRSLLWVVLSGSSKRRHEIVGDHVRALYGHSMPGRLRKQPGVPPPVLFHGTSPQAAQSILISGLRPKNRQFVHLSVGPETALEVGRRKADDPVVVRVDTVAALAGGVPFMVGNQVVWLAESIPAEFLAVSWPQRRRCPTTDDQRARRQPAARATLTPGGPDAGGLALPPEPACRPPES